MYWYGSKIVAMRWYILKWTGTLIIIGLILLGFYVNRFKASSDDSYIWLDSTKSDYLNLEQSQSQIQHLTNLTLQVQTLHINQSSNKDNLIWQTRGFYILLLAGLFPALFLSDTSNRRTAIKIAGIIMTVFMYGLDVQNKDLNQRFDKYIRCDAKTVRMLAKIRPDSTHWYYIDFDTATNVITKAKHSFSADDAEEKIIDNSLHRKSYEALTPTLDQSCFYMVPVLIFVWGDWKRDRKLWKKL
ncbi:MAG: hypothetical protein ACHQQQ_13540 [Bacteroidota bacterium]